MSRPYSRARVAGVWLVWLGWALLRGGDEFWRWLARAPSLRGSFMQRVLVGIARAHFLVAAWLARRVDACPACFFRMPCPYHWTASVGRHYARVWPNRRQRQEARTRAVVDTARRVSP